MVKIPAGGTINTSFFRKSGRILGMYDEESKRMLRQVLETSKENNKLLKSMRRAAIWGNIFRIIWWAIIIGVPLYLYFSFVQPVYEDISSQVEEVQGGVQGFFEKLFETVGLSKESGEVAPKE